MNLKSIQIYKITFKKGEDGLITKDYTGIIKPEDFGDVEAGISMVVQHIYMHKMKPQQCFGACCSNGNLLEIAFSKNAMGHLTVDSASAELTINDLENVLTGLVELLMRLHLERMAKEDIKITMKPDERTSSVDYTPESSLV